ncbi:PREDICTED: uncharacterized protein LOC104754068 [Camelina sativa]|uniref:Uncharacterized protein LOC104754068 n=1 Tax=Camelina sativa TaxID=90675 RepID=A0ABM0WQ36_CAMSA|nr:PREDICTED: uncharacterized protein LOC104754068 [Camelina sativa]
MGDESNPPPRTKDLGSPSIQCPMLTSINYTVWSIRMRVTLRVSEVWETIDPGSTDQKMNDVATALLFQSIPESLILQVGDQGSAKTLWEAIRARHQGAERGKEAILQTLLADLDRVTMNDTDSVDDFAGKISGLALQSASLGEIIDESKLGRRPGVKTKQNLCFQIQTIKETMVDIKETEEAITEEVMVEEEAVEEDMVVVDMVEVVLVVVTTVEIVLAEAGDEEGHYASSCQAKEVAHQETNLNETHEADALYVHEVVFLNEDKVFPKNYDTNNESIWYLDNGASNHMTGNKEFFSSLDTSIRGKVKLGDGSFVNIVGKGSIVFVGKTGERRSLKEIYYISDLKHNIISLGQATEFGCEVNMKGNMLTLSDPAGRLLVRVTRSSNHLYKTPMEVEYPKCLYIQDNDTTLTWHARL